MIYALIVYRSEWKTCSYHECAAACCKLPVACCLLPAACCKYFANFFGFPRRTFCHKTLALFMVELENICKCRRRVVVVVVVA